MLIFPPQVIGSTIGDRVAVNHCVTEAIAKKLVFWRGSSNGTGKEVTWLTLRQRCWIYLQQCACEQFPCRKGPWAVQVIITSSVVTTTTVWDYSLMTSAQGGGSSIHNDSNIIYVKIISY